MSHWSLHGWWSYRSTLLALRGIRVTHVTLRCHGWMLKLRRGWGWLSHPTNWTGTISCSGRTTHSSQLWGHVGFHWVIHSWGHSSIQSSWSWHHVWGCTRVWCHIRKAVHTTPRWWCCRCWGSIGTTLWARSLLTECPWARQCNVTTNMQGRLTATIRISNCVPLLSKCKR